MAKKTLWQRIKNFFSGNRSDAQKARTNRAIRQKNTGGARTSANRVAIYRSLRGGSGNNNEEEKRSPYKSMADAIRESSKRQTPDPKEAARRTSQENARKRLDDIRKERKEYHEATGHRYDVGEKGISKEEKAKRRQAVKMNLYDVEREKFETEKHPIAMSAARGAVSGVTLGGSELLAQKSKARKESGAEEFYQKHKNAKAEMAGEIVGSLASFGATAGATEKLATKVGGKAIERGAERLAEKKIIQNAAKRSVNKAVKKGLVKEGTEELIKQVGKDKAKKIATALGTDVVQNLTTGALYDVNKASAAHEVGSSDWWKELGKSAALNAAVTGGVAGVSAVRGSKGLAAETARRLDLQRGLRELADSRAGASRIRAPRIGESIDDRIARINAENPATRGEVRIGEVDDTIDVINPNVRRAAQSADEAAEEVNAVADAVKDARREMDNAYEVATKKGISEEERQAATDRFYKAQERLNELSGTAEATARRTSPAGESGFAEVGESMPSTDPALTAENETRAALERRVDEIAEDIPFTDDNGNPVTGERLKVNKVAEDAAASESLPSGVKQVRSAYEYNNGEQPKLEDGILTSWNEAWKASKEYSASHATGNKRRQSKVAVSELNAMDSEAERELRQRLADNGDLDYEAIDSHELYDKIAKQMRDDPDRWIKDMIEINEGGALDFRSTPEWQARVQYIMGTIDPSADQASEIAYTEAFKLAQNISSKGGQTLNLRRNFVNLTPMGKRDAILDDFINILDSSKGFRKNHPQLDALGHFDQRNYIRNILMEDDAIRDGVEKLVKANDPDDVSEAFTELLLNVNKKNPKAGFDVVQELRYLNMLGNPKTHIRNIFGSAFFSPMRQISNAIRAGIEDHVVDYAKRTSGNAFDVTKHGGLSLTAAKEAWVKNPTSEAGKAALEAFNKNKAEILGSAKYETTSYKGRGKTLAGKALDSLSDFNSKLLSGEDDFFRSRAYRESYIKSYNRYLKDGKPITDKVKRQIEKSALEESQIATFNEYNNFAKWLANITRKASDANASTGARWGGRAVNAVMPFTKVPANIMKQSMNYSPIGIAKGFANIKNAAKKGDSALLNKAIDELSSGLTGTGVFGLGMLLGKTTDMFTTNAGKNDPAAKFKKDRGMQNYSVTFKDPETGQGYSFTLDWLVPASATFFSGIELSNQMKSGDFNLLDIGGDWSTVMTRLAEPVMETSMLSGLHGMLETMRGGSNDDDTKSAIGILLRETAQSWLNSLVPTAAGQIARTAYKTDMQIAGDTDWEYFKNQVKSKAGFANTNILGEPLGADTDAYGNVKGQKNSTEDYIRSGLKNFLSPANIQKVDFSEVDNEKLAEYERRVKNGEDPEDLAYLFPKKQYKKKFDLAGEEIKMSNRDLSTYNQAKTTGGEEGMRFILENIMFNRQTLDEKGKKVPADSAYTKAEKQELMNQFKGKSMREVEEWLYAQPEFQSATDAERKKAIEGLWKLTKDTKAVASQRVGEQAVIKAQGGDVNEYNFKNELTEKKREALEPLIAAGVVTYEEAVDFARNAGKTYYTENDEGGSSATYYNKKEMIQYLIDKGYSYEKAEALFNAFKNANAKPYSGNNLSSGRGRRGYGYRRRGGSRRAKVPTIDAKSMASATKSVKGTSVKLTPPTPKTKVAAPKFKKYEV